MGTSAEFWRAKAWPRDTSEMIFLGRAVGQLGRALFGDHWLGDEFAAQRLAPVNYSDVRGANNFIAIHLSQFGRREYRGSMAPPPTSSIGQSHVDYVDHRPTFKEITSEERAAVREFIERHNTAASTAKERAAKLMNKIADLASEGKLQTTYRAAAGGGFNLIPKDWWNTERIKPRFTFCGIDPEDPFGSNSEKAWIIYVSRADLEGAIHLLSSSVQATINAETKCANWLEEQFRENPANDVSKSDYQSRAEKLFGIGSKAFLRAWDKATASYPERRKAGPKRKANRTG